ncbi:type IV pilus assembly protein PilP [Marinospirillum celere]|uniref:Type IV pilus assembly protein PilP n=1 Tax=Marinospirillum celere TaxID=1122252 RepID=A0A1I1IN91_9GAMM|nr:pilus assembly protein PilP [Marinospirillum celere]SFC37726.1 type IV pilus assembly protein PilP [Marinospirillum celere]
MIQPNKLLRLAILCLSFWLLSGCSDQPRTEEIAEKLQEFKERPRGRIDPLPEFPEPVIARYTRSNQRDPFTPDRQLLPQLPSPADSARAPDPDRQRSPLEKWNLSELALRGIMQKGDQIRGLVLTPDRQLVTVRVGDYIGRDHGRITAINAKSIQLVELIHDNQGGWQERDQELTLSR